MRVAREDVVAARRASRMCTRQRFWGSPSPRVRWITCARGRCMCCAIGWSSGTEDTTPSRLLLPSMHVHL
eukprot:559472-Pyramimonas_sp.AAC.1